MSCSLARSPVPAGLTTHKIWWRVLLDALAELRVGPGQALQGGVRRLHHALGLGKPWRVGGAIAHFSEGNGLEGVAQSW